MIAYASRTGTASTVAALAAAGWGWMVGPLDMGGPIRAGMRYALDNGAWPAFSQGRQWDQEAFEKAVDRYGAGADFIVIPDVVAGGAASLALSLEWLPRLARRGDIADVRLLIAVQNGISHSDVAGLLSDRVGIFVGGDTEWKLKTMIGWGQLARRQGAYVHIGRVNTARRIRLAAAAGANSFDGTSAILFPKTLPALEAARKAATSQRDIEALI